MINKDVVYFYDQITNKIIDSTVYDVEEAFMKLKTRLIVGDYYFFTLREFYNELGLDFDSESSRKGWNINRGIPTLHLTKGRLLINDEEAITLYLITYDIEPKLGCEFCW